MVKLFNNTYIRYNQIPKRIEYGSVNRKRSKKFPIKS